MQIVPVSIKSQPNGNDTITAQPGSNVRKSIYPQEQKKKSGFNLWAWGDHYRDLYDMPVSTKSISLNSLYGGLTVSNQLPQLHALILSDKQDNSYILRPLGGSSSFLDSKFFQSVYKKEDFKDTYLGEFITEAYTIIHPYMFLVSESLAESAKLGNSGSHVYYIGECTRSDTIADGTPIKDKLVSIAKLPAVNKGKVTNSMDTLLSKKHQDSLIKIDTDLYIKVRLFDMLIGDWNKVPENMYWMADTKGDSTLYIPHVMDRNHAFTKVDGVLFKELLNMLGLGFISNYDGKLKKVNKFNKLGYAQDIALTQNTSLEDWLTQAKQLKYELTDDIIDKAFLRLPAEMQNNELEEIKKNLKQRKRNLEDITCLYYILTQKTPVITGTDNEDRFVIEQKEDKTLHIRIYNKNTNRLILDKEYNPDNTDEIWMYGLKGDDEFVVDKKRRSISLLLIGGEGNNTYDVAAGKNVSIYEYKSEKERLKSVKKANVIIPNDETALDYNYEQLKYSTLSVTPIGIYDSDLGLNIGTSLAYTIYGFRRAPYTRRHQISYDYVNGFTYQGIFPSYDKNKSLHVAAYVGSPAYFSNFFGFGNNTSGYKNERNNYNRVNINKYMLTPALYYNLNKEQTFNIFGSFEMYKVKNPDGRDRFINKFYKDDDDIFSGKYYVNMGATYDLDKKTNSFLSSFKFSLTTGWNINLQYPDKNYLYNKGSIGINLKLTDRITFATLLNGTALYSDKYEFFQAATTELRGFRDNRFIGRYSLYQYSDIRLDMGELKNPLTPLNYGIFAGIDHGRVWYPQESSEMWHRSYGGGFWLTLLRKFTGKFSYFGSTDGSRFSFELGMGF